MEFHKGETVIWNNVECTIHHFSQQGMETYAFLDGVPDNKRTLCGSWQLAHLSELSKI